ncbi:response regulator transcription factor [Ohtaekwangia kribbensis]|jgi:DNA-binding NarL/FixJ family response regulator|uniref:Response regulator transcription factor n=1 Tax=Ohtaekwangia kribbensis TaxID=688913 RepID=A0ABW3KB14_9BACT
MSHDRAPLTIAIIEDHPVVVEGLQRILVNDLPVQTIREYYTGMDFLEDIKKGNYSVDVVLLDITLPDVNGIELCREIKSSLPDTYILGFSNHNDRSLVMQLLANGASGYILKNASAGELVGCILQALDGQVAFSEEIKKIISKPSAQQLKAIPPLTRREKQILKMIAEGKTSTDIAKELMVSPFTIETHRRNLMQKMDVKNAAALIRTATELQLLQ